MESPKHHASCKPKDRDLVWHCSQCGLNEYAEVEILDAHKSEIAKAKVEAVKEFVEKVRLPYQDFIPLYPENKHYIRGYNKAWEDQDIKIEEALKGT